uniref:Uncharacterized protein n=1 Tax=Strigamia maritima TaxID=126957 RepID=T1JBX4_STRMM
MALICFILILFFYSSIYNRHYIVFFIILAMATLIQAKSLVPTLPFMKQPLIIICIMKCPSKDLRLFQFFSLTIICGLSQSIS